MKQFFTDNWLPILVSAVFAYCSFPSEEQFDYLIAIHHEQTHH